MVHQSLNRTNVVSISHHAAGWMHQQLDGCTSSQNSVLIQNVSQSLKQMQMQQFC
jgi:hypothetical protein